MRRSAPLLLALGSIGPAAFSALPAHADTTSAISLPPGVTAGPSVEGISEYRLANGLRVLLFPDASTPTMLVNVTYSVGSVDENTGETGMAHLLEHLLFKGTPDHPRMVADFKSRGITFNGTTALNRTNYFGWFPANDDTLQWLLGVEADRMENADVSRKALDSEMTVVRNELEISESSPGGVLVNRLGSQSYLWHPYGRGVLGNRADVENVPIERLQDFYKRWYQPDNATVIVAGKIDPAQVLRIIQKKFGVIKRPARALPPHYTVEPTQDGERETTIRRSGASALIGVSYHIPAITHADLPALRVLDSVMGSSPTGRLQKALVETRLTTGSDSSFSSFIDPALASFYSTVSKGVDPAKVESVLIDTVENISKHPITDDEVTRAKQRLANIYDRANSMNVIGVANGLSEAIASGDWRLWFYMRDQIAKVSAADVNRVANYYFVPTNRAVARFIPTENPRRAEITAAPSAAAVLAGYTGRTPTAPGEVFDSSYTNIAARTETLTIGDRLKVSLLAKKSRGDQAEVSMMFRFGDEVSAAKNQDAGTIVGNLLMRGTTTMTRDQISEKLDALKARVSVVGSSRVAVVSITAPREALIPAMRLVADLLRHPALEASEFEQFRSQLISGLERQRKEPGKIADFAMRKHFDRWPESDPRALRTPERQAEMLATVTRDQVQAFHRDFYGTSDGEVVVVGNFDPIAVKAVLQNDFASWKSPHPNVRVSHPYFSPDKVIRRSFETPDKANAVIVSRENIDISVDSPDHPALLVAARVFGGGAMASRLGDRVRVKDGLSYYVGSGVIVNPEEPTGIFYMQATSAPENMGKVEVAMSEELNRFVKDGITQAELDEAKRNLLTNRIDARSTDGGIASILRLDLYLGHDLQWDAAFERSIADVTLDQVNVAIRRYIRPAAISTFVAGDFARTKQTKTTTASSGLKP